MWKRQWIFSYILAWFVYTDPYQCQINHPNFLEHSSSETLTSFQSLAACCLVHIGHQYFKNIYLYFFSGSIRVCLRVELLKLENVCIYCSRLFYCTHHWWVWAILVINTGQNHDENWYIYCLLRSFNSISLSWYKSHVS